MNVLRAVVAFTGVGMALILVGVPLSAYIGRIPSRRVTAWAGTALVALTAVAMAVIILAGLAAIWP